ncbi:uncharacterized protein PRCAT00000355001 [Priceomyces carsonii]|uniref:uncharacterized protein n=1 Tax=Priceomyces carsonii TaxID=28549 RepID=UPI002ED8C70F|nr:unnamed protein product [Priceomyces carsonii]
MSSSDWYLPIPIEDFLKINKGSAENIPDKPPIEDPVGGVDVRCGPILRLAGTHEAGQTNYRGSLMIVAKDCNDIPKITYKSGPSIKGEGSEEFGKGEFPGTKYYEEEGNSFFRYDIDLSLLEYEQKIEYYINSYFKQSFRFFVPSKDQSMNVVSFSCNGFSLGAGTADFPSSLWFDVLKKHKDIHYHVMLGGGDQIYADAIKIHSKSLQRWLKETSSSKKRKMTTNESDLKEFLHFYLNHYLAWFGQGHWVGTNGKTLQTVFPLTMSQIPSINIYDDHDIIDGFGSYSDSTMSQSFLKSIGNTAYKYYMLFQHQMNPEEKLHLTDPSWILGKTNGPFINEKSHSTFSRLGKEVAVLGLDCRTERKINEVITPSTYNIVFARLEEELNKAPDVKHLLVMLGVPIFYPRLVWLEWLLNSAILKPFRELAIKGIINKGLVNEFDGGVEVLDDLDDHWCSKNHKRERNFLVQKLINFGASRGVRITILSGDVHLCCIGRIKSKVHHHPEAHIILKSPEELKKHNASVLEHPENDARLIFNVISSAIVNAPPPDAMATLLNKRSKIHHFSIDCDEDIVPIFQKNPDGTNRSNHQFLNKRNWSDLIIARQSKYKDEVQAGIEKYPGNPGDNLNPDKEDKVAHDVKYPLLEDSLITTLHVEDDPKDFNCQTAAYELYIPKLVGKHKLEQTRVKHLY